MVINRQDTNGVKALLQTGELGYDNYPAGGDKGRVYVGDGVANVALAKKSEVDAKVIANTAITAGTATKVTYDAKGLVTSGSTLSATDIPALDMSKVTTGTLGVAQGGTGVTTSTGSGSVVLSTSPTLVTPSIGVATGTSFNSITALSSTAPIVDGVAAIGTSTTVARADHVHPSDTTKVTANANITAGTYKSVTVDVKGLVTGGTNPTTLGGYGITDAYVKSDLDAVNVLRADKYLAAQNIASMIYTSGDLTKIQYKNATDVDYEVLNYTSGNLTSINHYTSSVLRGTTTLSYSSGNLVSAIYA
jgi:phage-related tail fiber protein